MNHTRSRLATQPDGVATQRLIATLKLRSAEAERTNKALEAERQRLLELEDSRREAQLEDENRRAKDELDREAAEKREREEREQVGGGWGIVCRRTLSKCAGRLCGTVSM